MERNSIIEAMLAGWNSTFKVYLFKLIVKPIKSPTSVGLCFWFNNTANVKNIFIYTKKSLL